MKLGITGSRSITEFDFIPYFLLQDMEFSAFCLRQGWHEKVSSVISGGARGIDTLAWQAAEVCGIENIQFLPEKNKYPGFLVVKAYYERNKKIAENCDLLLAVWDGVSAGTAFTIKAARKIGKPVFTVKCGAN